MKVDNHSNNQAGPTSRAIYSLEKKHMTTIIKVLVAILGLIVLFGGFKFLMTSLDKSEVVSCLELVKNAEQYQQFSITEVEKTMCLRHGITIDAPVVK